MKKAVCILLLLVLVPSVFASYQFDTNVPDSAPYGSTSEPGLEKSPYYTTPSSGLPDLVVSDIILPDTLPMYSSVTNFEVEIKNVGKGVAKGQITIRLNYDAPGFTRCTQTIYAGGTFGSANPWYGSQMMKNTAIYPGQTLRVPVYYVGVGVGVPRYCQQPLQGDFTVVAEINPAGGGEGGLVSRGRILESDQTNNIFSKTVIVANQPSTSTVTFNFIPEDNAFTIPVKTDVSAWQFYNATRCDLFSINQTVYESTRGIDFSKTIYVPAASNTKVVPGKPYIARCPARVNWKVSGADLPNFVQELVPNKINVVTTRFGMLGRRTYEISYGCGVSYSSGRNPFFSIIPGQKHRGYGVVSTETVRQYNPIVPGQVLLVFCDNTYGGTWDPIVSQYRDAKMYGGTRSVTIRSAVATGSMSRYPSRATPTGGQTYTYGGSGIYS